MYNAVLLLANATRQTVVTTSKYCNPSACTYIHQYERVQHNTGALQRNMTMLMAYTAGTTGAGLFGELSEIADFENHHRFEHQHRNAVLLPGMDHR
jgi:hypothetical protein